MRSLTGGVWPVRVWGACPPKLPVREKMMRCEKMALLLAARKESISDLMIVESSCLNLH